MTHPFDAASPVGRRAVVATVGLTGLALAAPAGIHRLPDLLGLDARAEPAALTRASFAPYVGATFTLRAGDTHARADLERIEDLSDELAGDEDSFLLQFRSDGRLGQDTYDVARDGFAATPLLLVPGAENTAGTLTAVFNRTAGRPR